MKKTNMEWNNKIKERLQHMEVAPPDEYWKEIEHTLKKGKITPMISPYAKAVSWLKYSAAAVVAGIGLLTIINEPFRDALQNAVVGPGLKTAVIDSTPALQKDSTAQVDSIR
jgi:hypothetical protein